jgi:predicted metal-binding protein
MDQIRKRIEAIVLEEAKLAQAQPFMPLKATGGAMVCPECGAKCVKKPKVRRAPTEHALRVKAVMLANPGMKLGEASKIAAGKAEPPKKVGGGRHRAAARTR